MTTSVGSVVVRVAEREEMLRSGPPAGGRRVRSPTYAYIASPYTHRAAEIEEVREVQASRYRAAVAFYAWAVGQGEPAFSPIVHSHHAALAHDLPGDAVFWRMQNEAMLDPARSVWVLCIPGWRESAGVIGELEMARTRGIPALYFVPDPVAGGYTLLSPEEALHG